MRPSSLRPGARRAIAAAAILVFLTLYIGVAAVLGSGLMHWPWWGQAIFFAVAGIAWVFPLRPVFQWIGANSPAKRP